MPSATTTGAIHFVNLEYFFRLLYEAKDKGITITGLGAWANDLWHITSAIAFIITLVAITVMVYSTIRLRQLRHEEHHLYGTVTDETLEVQVDHARFAHILSLIESPQENDWRQAIIEADIMLDDLLKQHKYEGDTLGDRLKKVDGNRYHTLDNAWAAHKVRNDIAHQGIAFKLSNHLAYRTIKQYESVFKEFGEL